MQKSNSFFNHDENIQESNQMLAYYHVDSVSQLVQIMMNFEKSQTYNHIRNYTVPHIDLQHLKTIKSSIQYKRQLLLNSLYPTNLQKKQKTSNLTTVSSKTNIKENSIQQSNQTNKNAKYFNKKAYNTKFKQIIQTSKHSYEELQNYFNIKKDSFLCRKILQQKYMRGQIIQAHKIRKQFWLILSGIDDQKQQYPHMYQTLVDYDQYKDFFTRIIHADVIRTIHDTDQIEKKSNLQKMERILKCYARRNPYVGYCQGMNFILNFIMTMDFNQEDCFWFISTILQNIVPLGYYTNMSGVAIDIKILQIALKINYPKIDAKLIQLEIDLSVFVLQWLVCLFTSTLPFYLLVLVWDLMLIQGSVAFLKVSLILLQYIGPIVEEANDFPSFFKLYQNMKKKIFIPEQIFMKKYNQIYINDKILSLVRQIIEAQVKASKEQIRKGGKQNQKWKQSECSEQWPVCFQQLRRQKNNDIQIDVWVLKDESGPRMIQDYLNQKQRKSQKPAEDGREIYKKMVIGRTPHICINKDKFKTKNNGNIQLNSLQSQSPQQRKLSLNQNQLKIQSQMDMSPTDFYRRATKNSFIFNRLISYQDHKR